MRWLAAWVGLGLGCATSSELAVAKSGPYGKYRRTDEVMNVMLSHADSFRACALEARQREYGVTGKVVAELEIAASGQVTAARALTDGDTYFALCLVENVLPRIKFGPAPGADRILFPFRF